MSARTVAGRLVVGMTIVVLLGGCAAATTPSPSRSPASPPPSGTPTAATSASPSPAPSGPLTYGPVTVVSGVSTCPFMDLPATTDADGTRHVRGGTVTCTNTTDDPRVSGRHTAPGTLGLDVWGDLDALDFSLVQWATVRLENAGGAWEGRLSGVATLPGRGDIITIWYKGTGDYAGLSFFELDTGKGGTWTIQGQVFPGDPPPPYSQKAAGTERPEAGGPVADDAVAVVTGTGTCPTADLGKATTDAEGVTHYRGGTFICTMTTDDARTSGVHSTSTWNADRWGDAALSAGALVQWATVRLENDGGAWEGQLTGVAALPDPGDTIVIWYKGTGGYAGLSYFELWTGQDPWTIQGQIFPGDPPTP